MSDVIKRRRSELGLSQSDLAAQAKIDARQIRRYEAGDAQPSLAVARSIARALGITVDELAGEEARRMDLAGSWWACWQSWKNGKEFATPHEVAMRHQGDAVHIAAVTRGTAAEDGGYLWRGELRLWDNEALMGWYVANEGAVRSKGTMYFSLHRHGTRLAGRWVGMSYDGPLISGWAAMARGEQEVVAVMRHLRDKGSVPE